MDVDMLCENELLINQNCELTILEDEDKLAENYIRDLNLTNASTCHIKSYDEAIELLKDKSKRRAYLIDIDLGNGRTTEGLDVIIKIRESEPDSLIIVYSANVESQKECINHGANLFFKKTPSEYETQMLMLSREFTKEFLHGKNLIVPNWSKIAELPAKFVRRDDNYFYLNCMVDIDKKIIIEKKFPIECLDNFPEFYLDMPIMIYIKEGGNRICYHFDEKCNEKVNKLFKVNRKNDLGDLSIFNYNN
jgi:ActR/RegA family two-component response regulator